MSHFWESCPVVKQITSMFPEFLPHEEMKEFQKEHPVMGPPPRAPGTFVPAVSTAPRDPIMVVSPPLSKNQKAKKRQQMRKPAWRPEHEKKASEPSPKMAAEPSPKGSAKRAYSEIANDGPGNDRDESRANPFEVTVTKVVQVTNPVAVTATNTNNTSQ